MNNNAILAPRPLPANLRFHHQVPAQVDIRKLKEFASNKIPKDNPLREIIMSEQDLLGSTEFLVKVDVWLRLLRAFHP